MNPCVFVTGSTGNVQFHCYNSSNCAFERVDEIVTDIAYQNLSIIKLNAVLKEHVFRLVKLSDGTNKLYLHLRLLGGMMEPEYLDLIQDLKITDPQQSNEEIADKIRKAVPSDTYSYVAVTILNHKFPGENEGFRRSRKITISPRNWEWFVNMLRVLSENHEMINANRAVKALLGSSEDRDVDQLVKSYRRNYRFDIMVSMDEERFDFLPVPDTITQGFEGRCIII